MSAFPCAYVIHLGAAWLKRVRVKCVDPPEVIRDRYQYFTQSRMERLRAAGYAAPFTSLEDGARMYVQDYQSKDDPYL